MSSIIKSINVNRIRKTEDSLFFPIRIDTKSAENYDARYIKIVVLPQILIPGNERSSLNLPKNTNKGIDVFSNDNKIDAEEMGTDSTPLFYRKVFSKNITTNLLQRYFTKLEIYPENSSSFFDEYIVNISRREISSNLFKSEVEEYPHYFIVYCLDTNENIIDYKIENSPNESFVINDYPDADPEFLKEVFIDEIGGALNIEWAPLTFNEFNVILSGPYIKIDYEKVLQFAKNIDKTIDYTEQEFINPQRTLDFDITLRYTTVEFNESFNIKLETIPFNTENISAVSMENKSFRADRTTAARFSNSLSTIVFNDSSRNDSVTITDLFDNKFIPNLYNYFSNNTEENIEFEITIAYENFSYTKDIVVSRSNFMQYFTKFLEYNRKLIIEKTFENQFDSEVIMSDLLKTFAIKLSIDKFDSSLYTLGLLNNFSALRFAVDERIVNRLYLDDNLTEDNFLNNFGNNNFYINTVFNNVNISDFYLKNVTEASQIKIVVEGVEVFENSHEKPQFTIISDLFPDYLSYLGNLFNGSNSTSDNIQFSRVDIVRTQRDFNKILNVSFENGLILLSVNFNDSINRELINLALSIDLTGDNIEDKVLKDRLQNNVIVTVKIFNTEKKVFLGTVYKHLLDAKFVNNNTLSIDLNEEIGIREGNILIEVKSFLLHNNIINEFNKAQSSDVNKNNLTHFLSSLISNRFHKITTSIDNKWFNENISKEKVINDIGKLLDNSRVISPKILESINTSISIEKEINSNKAVSNELPSLRKLGLSTQLLKSNKKSRFNRNIINYCLDFSFENIEQTNLKSNVIFDISESVITIGKNKDKNDCIYSLNIDSQDDLSRDISDINTQSINCYSLFIPSFYNEKITKNIEDIKKSKINSHGCIIDIDYIDIIDRFKITNRDKTELKIDKAFKQSLNFNKQFYDKAKYLYGSSSKLKLKSIVNRIVLEINKPRGEKKFYAINYDVKFNSLGNSINSNNNKSNLSIDINNNKLYNPNIILLFNK
tara:strand:- start:6165 stop:9164 length:3000 start_codon:yes stop_codon:yes gene_type:complete